MEDPEEEYEQQPVWEEPANAEELASKLTLMNTALSDSQLIVVTQLKEKNYVQNFFSSLVEKGILEKIQQYFALIASESGFSLNLTKSFIKIVNDNAEIPIPFLRNYPACDTQNAYFYAHMEFFESLAEIHPVYAYAGCGRHLFSILNSFCFKSFASEERIDSQVLLKLLEIIELGISKYPKLCLLGFETFLTFTDLEESQIKVHCLFEKLLRFDDNHKKYKSFVMFCLVAFFSSSSLPGFDLSLRKRVFDLLFVDNSGIIGYIFNEIQTQMEYDTFPPTKNLEFFDNAFIIFNYCTLYEKFFKIFGNELFTKLVFCLKKEDVSESLSKLKFDESLSFMIHFFGTLSNALTFMEVGMSEIILFLNCSQKILKCGKKFIEKKKGVVPPKQVELFLHVFACLVNSTNQTANPFSYPYLGSDKKKKEDLQSLLVNCFESTFDVLFFIFFTKNQLEEYSLQIQMLTNISCANIMLYGLKFLFNLTRDYYSMNQFHKFLNSSFRATSVYSELKDTIQHFPEDVRRLIEIIDSSEISEINFHPRLEKEYISLFSQIPDTKVSLAKSSVDDGMDEAEESREQPSAVSKILDTTALELIQKEDIEILKFIVENHKKNANVFFQSEIVQRALIKIFERTKRMSSMFLDMGSYEESCSFFGQTTPIVVLVFSRIFLPHLCHEFVEKPTFFKLFVCLNHPCVLPRSSQREQLNIFIDGFNYLTTTVTHFTESKNQVFWRSGILEEFFVNLNFFEWINATANLIKDSRTETFRDLEKERFALLEAISRLLDSVLSNPEILKELLKDWWKFSKNQRLADVSDESHNEDDEEERFDEEETRQKFGKMFLQKNEESIAFFFDMLKNSDKKRSEKAEIAFFSFLETTFRVFDYFLFAMQETRWTLEVLQTLIRSIAQFTAMRIERSNSLLWIIAKKILKHRISRVLSTPSNSNINLGIEQFFGKEGFKLLVDTMQYLARSSDKIVEVDGDKQKLFNNTTELIPMLSGAEFDQNEYQKLGDAYLSLVEALVHVPNIAHVLRWKKICDCLGNVLQKREVNELPHSFFISGAKIISLLTPEEANNNLFVTIFQNMFLAHVFKPNGCKRLLTLNSTVMREIASLEAFDQMVGMAAENDPTSKSLFSKYRNDVTSTSNKFFDL